MAPEAFAESLHNLNHFWQWSPIIPWMFILSFIACTYSNTLYPVCCEVQLWLSVLTALRTNCTHSKTHNKVVEYKKTLHPKDATIMPIASSTSQFCSEKTTALVCCYKPQGEGAPLQCTLNPLPLKERLQCQWTFSDTGAFRFVKHWHSRQTTNNNGY